MTRSALWCVLSLALAGVAAPGVAQAGPPPPCSFTLTPPQVEAGMVTATLAPAQCGFPAEPATSVACLQLLGGGTVKQCTQSDPTGRAQVFVPLVPGGTYEATARGCGAWVGQPPAPDCQLLGPLPATL